MIIKNSTRIIFIILIALATLSVEASNNCHNEDANAFWEELAERSVDNPDMLGLYKLRKKLCKQIDNDDLTEEEAKEIFDKERKRVVENQEK